MIFISSVLLVTFVIQVAQSDSKADKVSSLLEKFLLVDDFEKYASAHMDKRAYGYMQTGSMLEETLRDNREAFSRYRLQQRVLQNTLNISLRTTILGFPVKFPIGISPTAFQILEHPEAENATARAAAHAGTIMILSSHSSLPMEQVAKSTTKGVRWFQAMPFKDRKITEDLMKRAEKSGYKAIVLDVDTPVSSIRITSAKAKFKFDEPTRGEFLKYKDKVPKDAFDTTPTLTWKDIPKLKKITKLPLVLKGILTGSDAELAIKYGADAIIVSNQGGRQLDGVPATLDALPDVIKAVKGRIEVYMDGGIRTGSDVVKALALGAKAVFIGRANLYGLFAGGEKGSRRILHLLKAELENVMHLIGVSKIKQLKSSFIKSNEYYRKQLE